MPRCVSLENIVGLGQTPCHEHIQEFVQVRNWYSSLTEGIGQRLF